MTTNYTPGPWKVQPDFLTVFSIVDGSAQAVAKVLRSYSPCVDKDAAVANATLIAAAPTMLETMEYVLPWLSELSREWEATAPSKRCSTNQAQVVINNLRNAILAARGQA